MNGRMNRQLLRISANNWHSLAMYEIFIACLVYSVGIDAKSHHKCHTSDHRNHSFIVSLILSFNQMVIYLSNYVQSIHLAQNCAWQEFLHQTSGNLHMQFNN